MRLPIHALIQVQPCWKKWSLVSSYIQIPYMQYILWNISPILFLIVLMWIYSSQTLVRMTDCPNASEVTRRIWVKSNDTKPQQRKYTSTMTDKVVFLFKRPELEGFNRRNLMLRHRGPTVPLPAIVWDNIIGFAMNEAGGITDFSSSRHTPDLLPLSQHTLLAERERCHWKVKGELGLQ